MAVDPEFVAVEFPSAHAQAPFYQGKTIRVLVGTPPGNLYDFWARLIADYMGKHIPGNPSFIVQNMPGAGDVVAVNHLYRVAKPDGLTLIGSVIPSLYLNQLVGRPEIQFDWAKFAWIGSPARGIVKCTCAPIRLTKPSKRYAPPRNRPNAAPPASPDRIPIFPNCCKKRSAPSSNRHRLSRGTESISASSAAKFTAALLPSKLSSAANPITPGARPALSITFLERQQTRRASAANADDFRIHGPI